MNAFPRRRRKLVVQLAALVDLLFVVMFLQFSELQRAAAVVENGQKNALKLKDIVLVDQEKLREERDDLQRRNEELNQKLKAVQEQENNVRAQSQNQIIEIGDAVHGVLKDVDPKLLMAQMEGASPEQRAKILADLKKVQGGTVSQVVQMFRLSAELRKRCDIWEVHLNPDGFVRVRAPDVKERSFPPKDESDFCTKFMEIVTEASEPKSLVLILFTHGNAQLRSLAVVTKGLQDVRTTWSGRLPAQKSVQVSAPGYSEDAP